MSFLEGIILAVAVGLTATLGGLDREFHAPAPRPQIASVDGHNMAYRVVGQGRPIVFISGLGDGMSTFDDVARELGNTNTVITYDRAGYGGSEFRTGPHDSAAAERELSGLLAATRIPGPYVLVGHSLGGLYAEYYASKHPDQVSALILEESRPSGFTARCAATGQIACEPPSWALWLMPKAARQEASALATVTEEVQRASPLRANQCWCCRNLSMRSRTDLISCGHVNRRFLPRATPVRYA